MSIYRNMVMYLWPGNTMRAAYLRWQAQEERLVAARQRLARRYEALRRQTQQVQAEAHAGILRTARLLLDQPPDPLLLAAQGRLARVFALLGKGFCRRLPSPLAVELSQYFARIEKICRSHDELAARLRLAQGIMALFERNSEFRRAHFFRLALTSPESAWLLFHLRHKRLQDRRAMQDYLSKDCQLST